MRRIVLLCLFFVCLNTHAITCEQQPNSVFFQPWNTPNLTQAQRQQLFAHQLAYATRNGYQEIILQWTKYGEVNFFSDDQVSWLYSSIAKTQTLKVVYGLYMSPDFFADLNKSDQLLASSLATIRSYHQQQAKKLLSNAPSAIDAWYLPEEIDDLNWHTPQRQTLLKRHLTQVVDDLHQLNAHIPVYISAFFGGKGDPVQFAQLLNELHQSTGVTWLIQDGLGVHRTDAIDTKRYLAAIAQTIPAQSWRGVLEIFSEKKILTASGAETEYCPASKASIKKRAIVWCHATGLSPTIVFSLNQLAPEYEGAAPTKQERCALSSTLLLNPDE